MCLHDCIHSRRYKAFNYHDYDWDPESLCSSDGSRCFTIVSRTTALLKRKWWLVSFLCWPDAISGVLLGGQSTFSVFRTFIALFSVCWIKLNLFFCVCMNSWMYVRVYNAYSSNSGLFADTSVLSCIYLVYLAAFIAVTSRITSHVPQSNKWMNGWNR